ncbi:hypothetical protein [Lentzea kentuckyensis]|uniref:hypothetical protein n=1 Tax=Lentzea kentuckyensis TaxID=360086 RepID=UPI00117B2387|nr:hypothetical protein [Lentzea kentuckyensis]
MPKTRTNGSPRPRVGVVAAVVGAAAWLVIVCRIESSRRAVCAAIEGVEARTRGLLDELCVAAHTLGKASARVGMPDLAREAEEAEDRAVREERGEVPQTQGHRAARKTG